MDSRDQEKPTSTDQFGWPLPSKTIGNRLFRFSSTFFIVAGSTAGILKLFWSEKRIGDALGPFALPFGLLFGACYFYFINYLGATVVRNPVVRILWIFMLSLIALLGGCAAIDYFGW